jgi:hypothetical protein
VSLVLCYWKLHASLFVKLHASWHIHFFFLVKCKNKVLYCTFSCEIIISQPNCLNWIFQDAWDILLILLVDICVILCRTILLFLYCVFLASVFSSKIYLLVNLLGPNILSFMSNIFSLFYQSVLLSLVDIHSKKYVSYFFHAPVQLDKTFFQSGSLYKFQLHLTKGCKSWLNS